MTDWLAAVHRGLVSDTEKGCMVYSTTHKTAGGFPIGGVVVKADDEKVTVCRLKEGQPVLTDIEWGAIDSGTMRFDSRDVRVTAESIVRWLASKGAPKGRSPERTEWMFRAGDLMAIADSGQFTPHAEARYKAATATS